MDDKDPKVTRKIRRLMVKIDRNLCIGAATCIALAPKAFALDDEAKAILLDTCEEDSNEAIIEAAKSCPVMAILIEDEAGKKIYP